MKFYLLIYLLKIIPGIHIWNRDNMAYSWHKHTIKVQPELLFKKVTIRVLKKHRKTWLKKYSITMYKNFVCTGCPNKGNRSELNTKAGSVLQNSGNFFSNKHKNYPFLWKQWKRKMASNMATPLKKSQYSGTPCRSILCPALHEILIHKLFPTMLFSIK